VLCPNSARNRAQLSDFQGGNSGKGSNWGQYGQMGTGSIAGGAGLPHGRGFPSRCPMLTMHASSVD